MAGVKRHPSCFLTEPELCVTIFQCNQNGEGEEPCRELNGAEEKSTS